MIKAIIFDWGGVLAPADLVITAQNLSQKYNLDFNNLKTKMGAYEDECSSTKKYGLYLTKIEKEFNIPPEEMINSLTNSPAGEGFELAKKLSKRFKTCILSNQMQFKTDHIKKNNDLSFFDHVLFSSESGSQKPLLDFFQIALKKLQEPAQNCLFIDDSTRNIQAAQKLGIDTIHCTDIGKLEEQINTKLISQPHQTSKHLNTKNHPLTKR